jgi:hypothetical protein
MHVSAAIGTLQAAAGNPSRGLPEEIFLLVSRMAPLINVDLLIQDEASHTLLTWRNDEYFGTGWHVPGGIIRYKEVAADRVRACAREELGAEVVLTPCRSWSLRRFAIRRTGDTLFRCCIAASCSLLPTNTAGQSGIGRGTASGCGTIAARPVCSRSSPSMPARFKSGLCRRGPTGYRGSDDRINLAIR